MRKRLVTVTAALIASALLAASSQAAELPVVYNGVLGYAQASSTASPPGANDLSCKPSKAHPRPVILVHGTFADMSDSWQALSPLLANHGYCVFALNYGSYEGSGEVGIYATGDIAQSAEQLGGFVTRVLSATGASKVDLVGHSQGGMMPRYYLRFLGGSQYVHTLVGLSPSNHGTTLDGLTALVAAFGAAGLVNGALNALCTACVQQEAGSAFLANLNAGGDTVAGATYTATESRT